MSDEIITDIDVVSMLATWYSAIIIQFDGALVILIYDVVVDLVSLLF